MSPQWRPATIAEVSDDMIAQFMGPLDDMAELTFDGQ